MSGRAEIEPPVLTAFRAEMVSLDADDFAREWVAAVLDEMASDARWTAGQLQTLAGMLTTVRAEYKRRMGLENAGTAGDAIEAHVTLVKQKLQTPGVVCVVLSTLGLYGPDMSSLVGRLRAEGVAVMRKRGGEIGLESGRQYSVAMNPETAEGMGG